MIQKEILYIMTPDDLMLSQFNGYFLQISKKYVLRLFAEEITLGVYKTNSYTFNPRHTLLYNADKT